MNKFRRSLMLFKRSMQVIGENKKLLLFPAITFILTCIIALFFLAPIVLWDTGHAYTDVAHWKTMANRWFTWNGNTSELYVRPACYVLFGIIYLVSMFLTTFFNVAFYNEILNALNGYPVSISGGLRLAASRLKAIFAWSLFSGIVGLIIKALEERLGWFGSWIARIVGIAWSVASVFVVPVIIREEKNANPVRFLKNSAAILKKTWGESLVGYLGVGFGQIFILLGSLVLFGVVIYVSLILNNYWILGIAAIAWFIGILVFAYFVHVASQVYLSALYIYATEGVVPSHFEQEQMNMAWKIKAGRKTNGK